MRGATQSVTTSATIIDVSIHAPRVGRDQRRDDLDAADVMFQSTRPVWGATSNYRIGVEMVVFQSTRPVWGATYHRIYQKR